MYSVSLRRSLGEFNDSNFGLTPNINLLKTRLHLFKLFKLRTREISVHDGTFKGSIYGRA